MSVLRILRKTMPGVGGSNLWSLIPKTEWVSKTRAVAKLVGGGAPRAHKSRGKQYYSVYTRSRTIDPALSYRLLSEPECNAPVEQ